MRQFNLIISTYRFKEEEAQDEILDLLEAFGDHDAVCEITDIRGILLVQTSIDPVDVTSKLKQITSSEPWQVRYVLRVLPVMKVVGTTLGDIATAVSEISSKIRPDDTFRITVEKRHTSLESKDVISAIASRIQSKVDLENPGWIVLVQILGPQTGISLLKPDEIYSSVIEKRR